MTVYEKFFKTFPSKLVLDALEKELKLKLRNYKKVDSKFRKKYCSSFEEFEKSDFLRKENYSWEVEKDFIEWEHAVEGIRYCTQKLKELQRWKTSLLLKK